MSLVTVEAIPPSVLRLRVLAHLLKISRQSHLIFETGSPNRATPRQFLQSLLCEIALQPARNGGAIALSWFTLPLTSLGF